MSQSELRNQIRSYQFAAYDMLLFLDTHPEDKKGFAIYKSLVKKSRELVEMYQQQYGPLSAESAADYTEFKWTQSPWPWEKGGNS